MKLHIILFKNKGENQKLSSNISINLDLKMLARKKTICIYLNKYKHQIKNNTI
jgi:hypothetical protein